MPQFGFGAGVAGMFAGICCMALAASAAKTPAAAQSGTPALIENLRNLRYCEVITVARQGLTFLVSIYNTTGLNLCPAEQLQALGAKALAKQLDVAAVKLNGPRYWTLDAIEAKGASANGQKAEFGGIAMTLRATLKTKIWQGTVGDKFYRANHVRRTTVFHYRAGAPVYELISPSAVFGGRLHDAILCADRRSETIAR